jgi:hypothetical protein
MVAASVRASRRGWIGMMRADHSRANRCTVAAWALEHT